MCEAITVAGLEGTFDGSDGSEITVFASTNAGFLNVNLNKAAILAMDSHKLANIIKSLTMTGSVLAEDLVCDGVRSTLLGGTFTTTTKCLTDVHGKAQIGPFNTIGNYPTIMSPDDIGVCNGLVQPVNNVIQVYNLIDSHHL